MKGISRTLVNFKRKWLERTCNFLDVIREMTDDKSQFWLIMEKNTVRHITL